MMKRPLIILAVAYLWLWLIGYATKGAVPFGFWKSDGLSPHATLNVSNFGYWKLDETSGTRADSSGMGNLITLTAQTNAIGFSNGVVGNGANFVAASNTYFSAPDATNFSMGAEIDFSVSCWVKLNTLGATPMNFVSHYTSGGNQRAWTIGYDGASKLRAIVSGDGSATTIITASANAATGTWYNCVLVHNSVSNTITLLTNGVTAASSAHTTGALDSTSMLAVGALGNPLQFMDGVIDEVAIWKKVLSPSEIADLFTTNRTCCPFPQ